MVTKEDIKIVKYAKSREQKKQKILSIVDMLSEKKLILRFSHIKERVRHYDTELVQELLAELINELIVIHVNGDFHGVWYISTLKPVLSKHVRDTKESSEMKNFFSYDAMLSWARLGGKSRVVD